MDPKDFRASTTGRVIRTPKRYWAFIPKALPPIIEWPQEHSYSLTGKSDWNPKATLRPKT